MTRSPLFGPLLAATGALVIAPDTLMMRLSGLDGVAMMAWRGGLTAAVFLGFWLVTSAERRRDLARLATGAGIAVIVAQALNAMVFSLAVAHAPVSVVLFGVATVPVTAALFARLLLGERTRRATWITIAAVLAGIAIAVFGGERGEVTLNLAAVLGALGGLVVACTLSLTFVLLRAHPALPILPVMGAGSALSGGAGLLLVAPGAAIDGTLWPIAVSGALLLPLSFFCFTTASRHTHAANVSLMLLLETILGPLLVWAGVGEAPTPAMFLGGAVVIVSLAAYLLAIRPTPRDRPAAEASGGRM
ncbi:DMT family transporter [Oceaniglobus roseus]|uniref:DMT family transporter n=1 Tax=Oceaniglobus roseus TaxID=1737570 RepID=UPI000C7EE374|nr:DMT family transporter [Kandeliimicrobium roseum]